MVRLVEPIVIFSLTIDLNAAARDRNDRLTDRGPGMPDFAIQTRGLTRTFGQVHALDDVTLDVPGGSVFGYLGPNGAGKTTTIRLLLGLIEPTSGSASVLGFDAQTQSGEIRGRAGALLEHSGLYERLSAEDNLRFFGRVARMPKARLEERIRELLTHLELWDRR